MEDSLNIQNFKENENFEISLNEEYQLGSKIYPKYYYCLKLITSAHNPPQSSPLLS